MKYPFKVTYVKDGVDTFWLAKSESLKGCIGQGQTPEDAIDELTENETMWLETAAELGIEIPALPVEDDNSFSGKISLRMSPAVHRKASAMAKREGISLNQYVNDAIVNYNAELSSSRYIATEVASIAKNIGQGWLSGVTASRNISSVMSYMIPNEEKWNSQIMRN